MSCFVEETENTFLLDDRNWRSGLGARRGICWCSGLMMIMGRK
jgi:hypothetical protein